MGGKTKQSQRTKNNVRPSSSGRSAELLSNTNLDALNIPISPRKALPTLFPTLATVSFDQELNAEFSVCFKKFTKKDPITKTKALQELSELVKNGNIEDTVAALPSWAHYYPMLTVDNDRRVREATQACHSVVVRSVGRQLAPQLRRLLPAWLLAVHDDHGPARALATQTLMSTFPEGKLEEALSFCKSEIMALITDNLTGNAEAMLSKKVEEAEEREQSALRVTWSSARALALLLLRLPRALDDWLWRALDPLLQATPFWKLATHKDARVRSAWYECAGRVAGRCGARLAGPAGTRLARALVATPERERAAPARRVALLHLATANEDWYTWLDKKDLLVKRLLDDLENGGCGSSQELSDTLLPLLKHLPPEVHTRDFYIKIFDAFFTGLKTKELLMSKTERQTWINILVDCLRYVSAQQQDFVTEVVTYAHRTWLENIFAIADSQHRVNLVKYSACTMTSLVKYWLSESKQIYDQIVRNFWQNIGSTLISHINKLSTDTEQIVNLLEMHILFLTTMQTAFACDGKKRSIKFEDDTNVEEEVVREVDTTLMQRFNHNLADLVSNISCQYFNFAKEKEISQLIFTPLIELIRKFDSKSLYLNLAHHFDSESVYRLYEKVLRVWLSSDTMRCKALVEIVFMASKYLNREEQNAMFSSFQQFSPVVVEWCVSHILSAGHELTPAERTWMRSAVVEDMVVNLCRRDNDEKAETLLLQCLSQDENGVVVGERGAARAVAALVAAVQGGAARRGARAAVTLAGAGAPHTARPLLLALYSALLQKECEPAVRRQWAAAAAPGPRAGYAPRAHHALRHGIENLDIKRIKYIVSLCMDLLPTTQSNEMKFFIKELLDFEIKHLETPVELFAMRCDIVSGVLNCPVGEDDITNRIIKDSEIEADELTKDDFLVFAHKSLFRVICLNEILLKDKDNLNTLLTEDYLKEELIQTLHEYVLLERLHNRYVFWPHYTLIEESKQCMEESLINIFVEMSDETKDSILKSVEKLSDTKGYYWSFVYTILQNGIEMFKKDVDNDSKESEVMTESKTDEDIKNVVIDQNTHEEKKSDQDANINVDGTDTTDSTSMDLFKFDSLEDILDRSGIFHSMQARAVYGGRGALAAAWAGAVRALCRAHAPERELLAALLRGTAAAPLRPDPLIDAYYRHNHLMLYDTDLSQAPWPQIVSNAAIVDYLNELVIAEGWTMAAHQWDFVTITLCSLATSLVKTMHNLGCLKTATIGRAVLRLGCTVRAKVAAVRTQAERQLLAAHVLALPLEWADIFAPDLAASAARLAAHLLGEAQGSMSSSRLALLSGLIPLVAELEWERVPAALRGSGGGCSGGGGGGELAAGRVAGAALGALQTAAHPAYHYLAYYTLHCLTNAMLAEDGEKLSAWSSRGEEEARPEPWVCRWGPPMERLAALLHAALPPPDTSLEVESIVLQPLSALHSLALGYLVLAAQLHRLCDAPSGDLHNLYLHHYKQQKAWGQVLGVARRLLPARVAAYAAGDPAPPPDYELAYFHTTVPLHVYEWCGRVVGALSCRALLQSLRAGGAGAAGGAGRALRRLVPLAVAPPLIADHLRTLRDRAAEIPDAQIKIEWSAGAVTCSQQLDERTLELTVKFSRHHPLEPPALLAPPPAANSPVPDTHWLALYLAHQNGSLLEALKMWVGAVAARLEGAAQCYICYCRLHPRTARLPAASCRQCRNKFHAQCLRKWFATGGKSICPICRTSF